MNTGLFKKIVLWPQIRKCKILWTHYRVSKYCRRLINEYYDQAPEFEIKAKKEIASKRIIWQYWAQGFDSTDIPEIVKFCLDSVEQTSSQYGYELIRISDSNISDYIELPEFVINKQRKFSKAFYSDLLRCMLLKTYGGCWLDATVYLSGPIPERYWNYNFFMYQRDDDETDKNYWGNAFVYYYGWYKGFKVRVLSSIICSKKNDIVISDLTNILLLFWSKRSNLPNYFFIQILFNELLELKYQNLNCEIESDCIPHLLQQFINDDKFRKYSVNEILSLTNIHKLTYKADVDINRIKSLLNSEN